MPLLVYTLLRILLVVVAGGVLYLLGLRGLLLVVLAVVVGALLSYLLLKGPRERAAGTLQTMAEREPRAARADGDALAEDAAVDASAEPEKQPEDDAERQLEQPGVAQDGDELGTARTALDPDRQVGSEGDERERDS